MAGRVESPSLLPQEDRSDLTPSFSTKSGYQLTDSPLNVHHALAEA